MKSMKKIVATVMSVAILGAVATTSFAASLDYTNEIQFSAVVSPATVAPGEDVTISFYMKDVTNNETLTMSAGGYYGADFAVNENFTYKSATIGQDFGTESLGNAPVNGYYVTLMEPTSEASVTADAPIFTYVFTVNADATAGTYDVITGWGDCSLMDGDGYEAGEITYDTSAAKITVAGGDDDTIKATKTAGTNNDSYEFANVADDSKVNGQKVALRKTKVEGTAITENTRVKVTAAGRTQIYGGDMWAKLNAEGEGTLAAKNVTFGIIFSDADLTADSFTFEIIEQ